MISGKNYCEEYAKRKANNVLSVGAEVLGGMGGGAGGEAREADDILTFATRY